MNSNKNIILWLVAFIVIVALIFSIINLNKSNNEVETVQNSDSVIYNEIDETYTIYDENNEVKATVHSEQEAQKYIDNPDYNPGLPETIDSVPIETDVTMTDTENMVP